MSFTESNTVEQMILDAATSLSSGAGASVLSEGLPTGWGSSLGEEFKPAKWTFVEPLKVEFPRISGQAWRSASQQDCRHAQNHTKL